MNTTAGWTAQTNGTRIEVVDENLMGSHTSYFTKSGRTYVKVSTVILAYDPAFSTAFATTFGSVSIAPGVPFGVATLVARLK